MEGTTTHRPEGHPCAVCAGVAVASIGDAYLWEEHGLKMTVTVDLRAGDAIVTVASA